MTFDIEAPDLANLLAPPVEAKEQAQCTHATISDLYFEQGDKIEEGELFAVLFNDNGTGEIVAPASEVLISLTYEEGDTVTAEAVLEKIPRDR